MGSVSTTTTTSCGRVEVPTNDKTSSSPSSWSSSSAGRATTAGRLLWVLLGSSHQVIAAAGHHHNSRNSKPAVVDGCGAASIPRGIPVSTRTKKRASSSTTTTTAADEEELLEAMKSTNNEWWMDPLAMFEDDEKEEEQDTKYHHDSQHLFAEPPLPPTPAPIKKEEPMRGSFPTRPERSSAEFLFETILPEEPSFLLDRYDDDDNNKKVKNKSQQQQHHQQQQSEQPPSLGHEQPSASSLFDDFIMDSFPDEIEHFDNTSKQSDSPATNQRGDYRDEEQQQQPMRDTTSAAKPMVFDEMEGGAEEWNEAPRARNRSGNPRSSTFSRDSYDGRHNEDSPEFYTNDYDHQSGRRHASRANESHQPNPGWVRQPLPQHSHGTSNGDRINRTIPSSAVGATSTATRAPDASTRGGLSSAASASPLLLTLIPRVRAYLTGNTATTTLLVFTAVKALFNWAHVIRNRRTENLSARARKQEEDESTANDSLKEDDTSAAQKRNRHGQRAMGDGDSSQRYYGKGRESADDHDEATTDSENDSYQKSGAIGGGWLGRLFQSKSSSTNSNRLPRPPASRAALAEQLDDWKKRFEDAEAEKAIMEKEYEKASWELQETLSELSSLKTTTRHLQAQLTDNEEMLARAIRTERRKAKEELLRMKEAMIKVVEREREAMRDEFMKQAAELQLLWKQQKEEAAAATKREQQQAAAQKQQQDAEQKQQQQQAELEAESEEEIEEEIPEAQNAHAA
ncbi:hypothetical protein ACA910_014597 [Epithemia clementina (nom. ined.)]